MNIDKSTNFEGPESTGFSLQGIVEVEEIDGEKVIKFPMPKAFEGHTYFMDFNQNPDNIVPEGPFIIDFVLSSEFAIYESNLTPAKPESGHSYLKLGKSLAKLTRVVFTYSLPTETGDTQEGSLTPIAEGGLVRRLRVELPEKSVDTSLRLSSQIVHSVLDSISLRTEVPVQIRHIEIRKESNGERFLRRYLTIPYSPVEIESEDIESAMSIPKPLAPALRLFREAINSSKPHYRLLCLYRVREVMNNVQSSNNQTLIDKGLEPERPVNRVPNNDLTRAFFPDLIGKRFGAFLDYVRKNYRLPVAHFAIDEYERMILDPANVRVDHRIDYTNAVLIQIIKQMINDEINLINRYSL